MTTAEKERLALYEQLNSTLGPEPAETLMEYLPSQKWADLATKEDLRLLAKEHGAEITELRADMTKQGAELRAEMQAGFARIDGQFAQVMGMFARIDGRFAQVESQFAQVDGQFAQVKSQFAQVESKFAEMESKFAQQTRTIVLALGGFAATIWASMLTTALIVT